MEGLGDLFSRLCGESEIDNSNLAVTMARKELLFTLRLRNTWENRISDIVTEVYKQPAVVNGEHLHS